MERVSYQRPITAQEIHWSYTFGHPMPNNFTGKWGDAHYYKGKRWFGPTNLVGAKKKLNKKEFLTAVSQD